MLWRRIVFSVMISNTDDHLRNHGFLYHGRDGWRLAPAYDLNPVPVDIKPRVLSTAIDLDDTTASLDRTLEVAAYFDLDHAQACDIARQISKAASTWRQEAMRLTVPDNQIDRMATAFHVGYEHNHDVFARNIIVTNDAAQRPEDDVDFRGTSGNGAAFQLIYPPMKGPVLRILGPNLTFNEHGRAFVDVIPRQAAGTRQRYTMAQWQNLFGDCHSVFADPRFLDPNTCDYRVDNTSPALLTGFRNFPTSGFGVRQL